MRVLFLTHAFPRHEGDAAGSFVLRLASTLVKEGVSIRVLAPAEPGTPARATLDGVEIERFRYAPARLETLAYVGNMAAQVRDSWSARLALLGMLAAEVRVVTRATRELRPDLVHAHWWFPNGLAASVAGRITRTPQITTFHGSDVRLARGNPASHSFLRQVMRRSAAVTAVSTWLATEAREIAGGDMPIVAPMPVATELFSPDAGAPREGRLLFVGRLTGQKGLDLLLRALALLPSDLALDVVGDGVERGALETLAETLGLSARVRWHGACPASALAPFYRAAIALVVPSIEEGLGLVVVEAALCETPSVAFASGGLTDVIEHDVSGILVQRRDPSALAAAIAGLLARPDRGVSLGRAGRERALARFAPDVVARRYLDIYRTALERSRK